MEEKNNPRIDENQAEYNQPKTDPKHSDGRQTWQPQIITDPNTKYEPEPQKSEPNFDRS